MTLRCIPCEEADRLSHSGEIHVWRVMAADWLPLLADVSEPLNPEEQERAARFRFERDRRRFTLCRGLLRTLLGDYLRLDPSEVEFRLGPHDKPELVSPGEPRLEFNLSHSGEAALFVFASGRRVGIDIELMRSGVDLEGVGRHVFTPSEIEKLSAAPEHQKQDVFFKLWTQKEALIKAAGLGLSAPVREITVGEGLVPAGEQAGVGFIEQFGACWSVLSLDAPAGYKAALAVEGRVKSDQLKLRPLQPQAITGHSEPQA